MSAVTDFVEDTFDFVGDVVEGVGDVIEDVADVAFDIVEDVGSFVGDTIERAIDNPIGTIAQVAAVATGNAWALPLISAGDVIVHGGDLEDAVKAAGMTYIAQGVVNYAATEIAGASNFVDYGGPIEYTEGMFDSGDRFTSLENSYYGSGGGDYGMGIGDYDIGGNSLFEPRGGGAVDLGINPDTGAVRMDFTGMADSAGDVYSPGDLDFGPGANTVPSGGVYDILEQNPYVPPAVIDFPVNDYPPLEVTPGPLPDWYTNPATDLPSTDLDFPPSVLPEPPYDPYADQGPSTSNPDVVTPDTTVPDLGEVVITDDRPVTPVVPDLGEVVITDNRPVTPVVPDVPEIVITDDRPVTPVVPEPEVPEIVITDDRPPPPPPEPPVVLPPVVPELPIVDPEVPEIVIVDDRPPPPPPEPPVILPPVVLDPPIIDPELPEIVIVDDRPPPPPPEPPVVLPPVVPEPPIVDPEPEPPVVVPPVVPPIIVVPPIPPDPPVVPPVPPVPPVTPPPRQFGGGLNPGFIQPTAFYNTTNPNQSQFYWGGHGYQAGPTFNQQQYNQVAAPVSPWGLQAQAQPLTGEQISNVIAGQPLVQAPVNPATRFEQYQPNTQIPPSYGQVQLNPQYTGAAATRTSTPTGTNNMDRVTAQLGENWFNRQQAAATAGDWDNYYAIQKQVDNILYKP